MEILTDISEDEMVARFLRGELTSERFGADLRALVRRDGVDQEVILTPELTNDTDNAYRRALLGEFRGYGQNTRLFEGFPSNLTWQRAALTPAELLAIKYIDYDYWVALSRGSRLPGEAARAIQEGIRVFDLPVDGFMNAAEALRKGTHFPDLICVRMNASAQIVVLEGHVRLTAYAMVPEMIPVPTTIILGTSPAIAGWGCY